jgi:hypothetical protein
VDVDTIEHAPDATDPAIALLEATERYERALWRERIRRGMLATLDGGAPARWYRERREAWDRARGELDAARSAYDAAQDIACPA